MEQATTLTVIRPSIAQCLAAVPRAMVEKIKVTKKHGSWVVIAELRNDVIGVM